MEQTSDTVQASSKSENIAKDRELLNPISESTVHFEKVMQLIYF